MPSRWAPSSPCATRRSTSSTAISEILGQTLRFEEAARTILREVSTVGRAPGAPPSWCTTRSSTVLRMVASRGFHHAGRGGRVARRRRTRWRPAPSASDRLIARTRPAPTASGGPRRLSRRAPISRCRSATRRPAVDARCIGVINLTDRLGERRLRSRRPQAGHRGRQPGRRRAGERPAGRSGTCSSSGSERELELAHDLQLQAAAVALRAAG